METVYYPTIQAQKLSPGRIIVEGRIHPVTEQLCRPIRTWRVTTFRQQGHEVRVTVERTNGQGKLNWRYEAESLVYVQ